VLADGTIVFSRYESVNGGQISLYRTRPDGTQLELYYGENSHATGASADGTNTNEIQFLNARQRNDGKLVAIVRPFTGTQLGGDILQIDAANYVECDQPSTPITPSGTCANGRPAQGSATSLGVTTDANQPSLGGRFASVYPLYDGTNRMLVSWAPCLVVSGSATTVCTNANSTGTTVQEAPPPYTIWIYDFGAGTLSPVLSSDLGVEIIEPVILQARTPAPTFIPDAVPVSDAGQALVTSGVGILDISSVYDFDGIDTANPGIVQVSDPTQTAFYTRPARFIRIEKAVEIPDKTVRKINASAFGPAGMGMREILGYAPIEPDGSVQIQVPANVPFTIDILDKNARRITARHTSWLQLLPGETKSCNGCHSTARKTSHGRAGLTVAVNPGAPTTGQPFPNTDPALFANAGETMAQTRARISCASGSALSPCSQILSTDVLYTAPWTEGVTLPTGEVDSPIAYRYSDLQEPGGPPTNANCAPWSAQCRVTLHYANAETLTPVFLQNVWNLASRTATVKGVAGSPVICVTCHTPNAVNGLMVPAGQLDLRGVPSTADATVVTSYESLLFPRDEQTLTMGVLMNLIVDMAPVPLGAPMTAGSASASTAFLGMFDGTFHDPVLDHTGFLTPAELRLISEWLDIGGQFYNDPFVAPIAN
jgi:hypothetical protein